MKAANRTSRLSLVREGKVEAAPRLPKRGQVYVDIKLIVPDPANERKNFLEMDDLVASVKCVGVIEPPTVAPLADGRYQLTTGERRWRAAKMAGLKRLHVIVGDPEAENTRRLKSLMSNIQRADLGPVELAQALQSLKDDRPEIKTNRQLASLIGKSENWVGHMLKILALPQNLQTLLAKAPRPIPYDVAQHIARIEDPQSQAALIHSAIEGASVRIIREEVNKLKGKLTPREKTTVHKIKTKEALVTIKFRKAKSNKSLAEVLEEALEIIKERESS